MNSSPQFVLSAELMRDKIEDWKKFPFNIPVVSTLEKVSFHPNVTFFVGENGVGKSTLIEAFAVASGFNPEGGSKNFSFSTHQSHSELSDYLRLAKSWRRPKNGYFLRAESFYNVATEIERLDSEPSGGNKVIDSYGGKSLHKQSHGESFMSLMTNRFGNEGLYILDEPEAALSPARQFAMLRRMHELVKGGSQFVVATHSPILMAYPESVIYNCNDAGLSPIGYKETDHYVLSKRFLNDPEGMLSSLLTESPLDKPKKPVRARKPRP